jgi:hypothetical protein
MPIVTSADVRGFLRVKKVGGADRDRTDDPLLAKQVLSQLSYSPNRVSFEFREVDG